MISNEVKLFLSNSVPSRRSPSGPMSVYNYIFRPLKILIWLYNRDFIWGIFQLNKIILKHISKDEGAKFRTL